MLKSSLAAVAALIFSAGVARAQETTLIFATTLPPFAAVVKEFLHPWAARVNAAGEGKVKLDVRDGQGLANHLTFYDRTINDVIQVGWGSQASIGGKFKLTSVVTLPFEGGNALPTALSLWRLYKTGQMDAEYEDVVPIAFVTFPQTSLHMVRPLPTLDNLNGVKIAVVSKAAADAVTDLGGAPITLSAPEIYDSLQRRLTDGAAISFNGGQTFKLHEQATYHVDAPLGSTPAMIFMAKKKFMSLPAAVQQVMTANAGEAEVRRGGEFQDKQNAEVRESLKEKGHTLAALSPAQMAAWAAKVRPIADEWAKSTPGGEKALATYRELFAKAKMER